MRDFGMPLANSLDAIMGVSDSATKAEKPTAAATVTPNSPNSRPVSPVMKEIGHEHGHQHQRGRDHREADLARCR